MKTVITICMGSSCYARGNAGHLEIIEEFIAMHGLEDVEVVGRRCENVCTKGPTIAIDGVPYYGIDRNTLIDLLKSLRAASEAKRNETVRIATEGR